MAKQKQRRLQLIRLYGHKYKRHFADDNDVCFYCGFPAEVYDHVPPISMMELLDNEKIKKDEIPLVLIRSCSSCNGILGDRHLLTALDRLIALEVYYEKQLSKVKAFWTDTELKHLEGILYHVIKAHKEKTDGIVDRIRHIQKRQIEWEKHPKYQPDEEEH